MSSAITAKQVEDALSTVIEPELHQDLITLNFIRDIEIQEKDIAFTIMLTTPACPLKKVLESESTEAIRKHIPDAAQVKVSFNSEVKKDGRIEQKLSLPIKNIIAVGSGKGGVGKSTVSTNLAACLAADGAKTGLLDADIYGPNIPLLMGIIDPPEQNGGKIKPVMAHGVETMSMGFLIPENEALVWRGPMLHSAISQLFSEVLWNELDYLVVDLPPGTGDAQLSLAQLVPLTGGIVVTGPQKVATSDARRGITAFNRLGVPVMGVVENMSGDIFGRGGGAEIARDFKIDLLATIDLHPDIPSESDQGTPFVISHPDHEITQIFQKLARVVAGKISVIDFNAK
ncbi:MAG: Mrp/NBP35 family ATP-binding protein [Spirochaetales bacterium]|jgi:ATP-binding protein involved in chromosome partitioning|nr:Mrp/NBP35 family ATP-binding protein [Spirochaetales bacterium]